MCTCNYESIDILSPFDSVFLKVVLSLEVLNNKKRHLLLFFKEKALGS